MNNINQYLNTSFQKISKLIKFGNQINLGSVQSGSQNQSGDLVKQLDLISHNIIVEEVSKSPNLLGYISEEHPNLVKIDFNKNLGNLESMEDFSPQKYVIAFDPLDGSSNIDSNITTGTIYGIYKFDQVNHRISEIVAAGYCLYGPATIWVRTDLDRVNMFQLNENNDFEFVKNLGFGQNFHHQKVYSVNESYFHLFFDDIKELILNFKNNNYNHRYIGSMISDCHRTIIQGGVFLYPKNKNRPNGKIRLLYEGLPFSLIFKYLGGVAYEDLGIDIIDKYNKEGIYLDNIHSDSPIILSSKKLF